MTWFNLHNWRHKPQSLIDTPTETDLKRWAVSEWIEYQAWLFHHSFLTLHTWQQLRAQARAWTWQPLISIVTPVFNTPPRYLRECIYSVQTQAYPYWEMCLIDDGSDDPATLACLQTLTDNDPRLRYQRLSRNHGICVATNHALAQARGEYVAFLDHDDRLAPDALYQVAATLQHFPDTDILYSDRDMLSPVGFRYMHLLKPDWSPETLLSGNYLFHLMVYRRALLTQLGGLRPAFEGSQDYDLILRAAETRPHVRHIPKVLYHWRQHERSIALEQNAKEYTYTAGLRALEEALQRRGLTGTVSENPALWRGNYRVHLTASTPTHHVAHLKTYPGYAQHINELFKAIPTLDCLVTLGPGVQPLSPEAITEMLSWLHIADVGLVTGKILDSHGRLRHAGLVQRPTGIPLAVYTGAAEETPGYLAVTASVRNVSTPHPGCCVWRRTLWEQLGGLDERYYGTHAAFDFALRALKSGVRTVYTPFARFGATTPADGEELGVNADDTARFVETWAYWFKSPLPSKSSLPPFDKGGKKNWFKSSLSSFGKGEERNSPFGKERERNLLPFIKENEIEGGLTSSDKGVTEEELTPIAAAPSREAISAAIEGTEYGVHLGDPYYNPHLTLELTDMGLNLRWLTPEMES